MTLENLFAMQNYKEETQREYVIVDDIISLHVLHLNVSCWIFRSFEFIIRE